MLQVAADAMADAGLADVIDRPRMGAVIGLDFDFEATNYHFRWSLPALVRKWRQRYFPDMDERTAAAWTSALQDTVTPPLTASRTLGALGGIVASRIAREFRFGNASFGVSAEAASGNRALEIGVRSLQRNEADAVLVGAVDLAGDIRQILNGAESGFLSAKGTVCPFDRNADGTLPGEGAAALIIKRHAQAVADGDRIYALVSGIGNSCGATDDTGVVAQNFSRALKQALEEADVSPADIDYVESIAQGIPERDRSVSQALKAVFSDRKSACSLGSSIANLGHSGAASGLAAVVKTALSLYHEIIPPLAGYRSAANDIWQGQGFSLPNVAALLVPQPPGRTTQSLHRHRHRRWQLCRCRFAGSTGSNVVVRPDTHSHGHRARKTAPFGAGALGPVRRSGSRPEDAFIGCTATPPLCRAARRPPNACRCSGRQLVAKTSACPGTPVCCGSVGT